MVLKRSGGERGREKEGESLRWRRERERERERKKENRKCISKQSSIIIIK